MVSPTSILIVDDHEIVRAGLRTVLQKHSGLQVVGEAASAAEALSVAEAMRPDIVIMDLAMPGGNGTEATRRVLALCPESKVVVLTAHEELPYARELLSAGARGYVLKRSVLAHLLRAIDVVTAGGIFLDPALARDNGADTDPSVTTDVQELSPREVEVASMTAKGHSNAEIAAALEISVKTVETHKSRLMAKLRVTTRAQLVRYATYRGWV